MPTEQTPEFEKAVKESHNLKSKPDNSELLELYGLFKQGTQDPPFDESKTPSMFDLKEKIKRSAWQKVHEAGVEPEDAQKRYVEAMNKLKVKYGLKG
ncbi:acyl-CoA-binding protein [Lepidopterella palustris CBS 459.81]|uniref:Acyl-CoA-binding protein n=1 Tax=Lepidopterella palustris CBS 459.81 TaxID=1314670 RepID=A0A8E2E0E9_9PEZI|nr:acyl-CoA-binding protein [Lepidopterella palustris CBS 459.81]